MRQMLSSHPLERSEQGRTLFIGDVHGCVVELEELLEKCGYQEGDTVVLVGDLVGKGPYSKQVIRKAMEINAMCVRGNHDDILIEYYEEVILQMPKRKKSHHIKREYVEIAESLSEEEWNYLVSCPFYLKLDVPHPHHHPQPSSEIVVVHGGFDPSVPNLDQQDPFIMMNIRNVVFSEGEAIPSKEQNVGIPWVDTWNFTAERGTVVFGHDAVRGIQFKLDYYSQQPINSIEDSPEQDVLKLSALGLDTGCCYGGMLSAWVLPENRIVQVKAHEIYEIPKLKLTSFF